MVTPLIYKLDECIEEIKNLTIIDRRNLEEFALLAIGMHKEHNRKKSKPVIITRRKDSDESSRYLIPLAEIIHYDIID